MDFNVLCLKKYPSNTNFLSLAYSYSLNKSVYRSSLPATPSIIIMYRVGRVHIETHLLGSYRHVGKERDGVHEPPRRR